MKKKIFILFLFVLVLLPVLSQDEDLWTFSLDKISSIVSLIETHYFEEVDLQKLAFSSIRGLLQTLDPHSFFLDPESFSRMREEQTGRFFGLGIQIQKQGEILVVISPIEGTPAWRLGIQAGDVISHINGESTKPLTSFEAMQKLRGEKGTQVDITIIREGLDDPLELTVTREEIPLHSVPYAFMVHDDVGYVFIRNFAETTVDEFKEKMSGLIARGMKNLILDMRGNSGGPLFQSIDLSDEFLPKGSLIVSIKGRNKAYDRTFKAVRDNQYEKIPLVILINQGSASASEIVSGAVMDNDRGLVVGEDSWGKGLVQTVFPLRPNVAVALTTAKYLTPSGRSIQRDFSQLDDYFLSKETPLDQREVRYTAKGRKVLGQGGITPDYEVVSLISPVTARLMMRGAFYSYARRFLNHQTPLSTKFVFPRDWEKETSVPPGKILIGGTFIVDASVVEDFKDYLRTNSFEFDQKEFSGAEQEIRRELERELHSAVFGVEEGVRVHRKTDPVVLKALEILPEARRLIE